MSDTPDQTLPTPPKSRDLDEIPVDELIRLTREFTNRITNQDRQRLGLELRESGHARSMQVSAPLTLQQFFSGEIDLDTDLSRRFANAPLMSHIQFYPKLGEPVQRQATAILSSNDDAATLNIDASAERGVPPSLEFTFTLYGALALRFRLSPLVTADRTRWIELMRRESGIAFLWTRERWEQPYTVFVVREHFARLYAFSPTGIEAAARLTPDGLKALVNWLEGLWFPERQQAEADEGTPHPQQLEDRPTQLKAPARSRLPSFLSAVPDTPEEQWEERPDRPDDQPTPPAAEETDLPPGDLQW
ncbi:MAG: hypothetical protein HY866_20740 [Chloroflexi bacterium]|nr:hypothetical protein [Chloroflexota bacterium]